MAADPLTPRPSWFSRLRAHRVARNAGALGVVQVVNYGAAFAVLIHLTRVLGVETYGVVAFSIGITQVLSVVLDLGFAMSATQRIAKVREDHEAVARITGAAYVLKFLAFLIGGALLAAYGMLTVKYAAYSMLFVLSLLPLLGYSLQPFWFFAGIERMRHVTAFTVVARLSFVAFVFLFVSGERDFLWVPVADGIAQLAAAAVALVLIRRSGYRVGRPSRVDLREAIRSTRGFFFSRLAATAQTNGGVILLGLAAAPATVALYALAEQVYRAMHAAFAPVTHALYPYMVKERDLALWARVTLACAAVAAVGSVIGHFLAEPVIPPLLGEEWRGALPVLDVFFVGIVVHVLVLMAGYPLAAALDRLSVANWSVIVGTVVYFVGAAVLLARGELTPTAFAWLLVVSEVYVLGHCAVRLLPLARRRYTARLAEAHL